jgi:DNA topoisomerase I
VPLLRSRSGPAASSSPREPERLLQDAGERYAELDHHYGATTLEKRHVGLTHDGGMRFDYIAKEGKRREVTVTDGAVLPTVRGLASSDNGYGALFCWEKGDSWRPLRSSEVTSYMAEHADGHFTAKEFRTWNATVLMALQLANARPSAPGRGRQSVIAASVREVAGWLGDTPAVARASYIHPALISRYESDGRLPAIPPLPAILPAAREAEAAIAALLAAEAGQAQP